MNDTFQTICQMVGMSREAAEDAWKKLNITFLDEMLTGLYLDKLIDENELAELNSYLKSDKRKNEEDAFSLILRFVSEENKVFVEEKMVERYLLAMAKAYDKIKEAANYEQKQAINAYLKSKTDYGPKTS